MTTEQHDLYDWDTTNDEHLNYLKFCFESAKNDLQRRKEWLLSLPESGRLITDMGGGAVVVFPPKLKQTT